MKYIYDIIKEVNKTPTWINGFYKFWTKDYVEEIKGIVDSGIKFIEEEEILEIQEMDPSDFINPDHLHDQY